MKKILFLLITTCLFSFYSFCQSSKTDNEYHKNFLIFIDAKLPASILNGYLEFVDTMQQKQVVNFIYETGNLIFEKGEYEKLNSYFSLNDKVTMYLNYIDFMEDEYDPKDRLYKLPLTQHDLRASSVVLMIANENKKKGEYAFDIYSDHIEGISSGYKAMRESRKLRENYWIKEQGYKRKHNIFKRMWNSILEVF